jgi:hypothetical protein
MSKHVITEAQLLERKALLLEEHAKLQAQLYGLEGAVQDVEYLLQSLTDEQEETQ